MAKRTYQAVQLPSYDWQVLCVETQKEIAVCTSKHRAVLLVTQLNARARSAEAAA